MVQDDPEDLVQELHTGQVLGRHPLGRSILGREATIQSLKRPDLLGYIDAHYDPGQIVIAIAGNFEQTAVERLVARFFGKKKPLNGLSRPVRRPPKSTAASSSSGNPWTGASVRRAEGIAAGHRDRYAAYARTACSAEA